MDPPTHASHQSVILKGSHNGRSLQGNVSSQTDTAGHNQRHRLQIKLITVSMYDAKHACLTQSKALNKSNKTRRTQSSLLRVSSMCLIQLSNLGPRGLLVVVGTGECNKYVGPIQKNCEGSEGAADRIDELKTSQSSMFALNDCIQDQLPYIGTTVCAHVCVDMLLFAYASVCLYVYINLTQRLYTSFRSYWQILRNLPSLEKPRYGIVATLSDLPADSPDTW